MPQPCCIMDCQNAAAKRGLCNRHYLQAKRAGLRQQFPRQLERVGELGNVTREYQAWLNMKTRCTNPNYSGYANYGGRGITYDPAWEKFTAFYADLGACPAGYSLDRIDNDGNYCKENCRWTTRLEQNNNQRLRRDNNSGRKGISWSSAQYAWTVQVTRNGRRVFIGRYKELDDAIQALDANQ